MADAKYPMYWFLRHELLYGALCKAAERDLTPEEILALLAEHGRTVDLNGDEV